MGTSPAALAAASIEGQSAAACCGVRLDCALKFGSLKPSTYREPAGKVALRSLPPQIMGANSIAPSPPELVVDQSYHHEIPGDDALGAKAADGAEFAPMPRL